jgi:hypothetical protein
MDEEFRMLHGEILPMQQTLEEDRLRKKLEVEATTRVEAKATKKIEKDV